MLNDLRFAFRQLLKNHGFTAVAVLTLEVVFGIGAYPASSASSAEATAGDRIEMIDIGGRKLQILNRGTGSPAVVIEAGMGEPAVAPGPNEPESIRKARQFLTGRTTPDSNPEQIDPKASAAQVRAARALGDKPVVILSHSSSFRLDPSLPEEVSLKLEKVAGQLQADLKGISSNSTLRQSASGGHYLHVEDPELVIQGIRHALDTAKKRAN